MQTNEDTNTNKVKALEAKARRAARRSGFVAAKSRERSLHSNNRGGFQLIEPYRNEVVNGVRYDLTVEEVIEFCVENRSKWLGR
jgi:hypothetical protein